MNEQEMAKGLKKGMELTELTICIFMSMASIMVKPQS